MADAPQTKDFHAEWAAERLGHSAKRARQEHAYARLRYELSPIGQLDLWYNSGSSLPGRVRATVRRAFSRVRGQQRRLDHHDAA